MDYYTEIGFDKFTDMAEMAKKSGRFTVAAGIYRDISEAIAGNMDDVDDSNGYYGGCFIDAIRGMVSCIKAGATTHAQRRRHILYMFDKYIKNDPDYFSEHYTWGLWKICKNKEDLAYWRDLIKPHVPDSIPLHASWSETYGVKKIIRMYAKTLIKLKDESAEKILAKHYRKDEDICKLYIKWLKPKEPDTARAVALEGSKLFPREKFLNMVGRDR